MTPTGTHEEFRIGPIAVRFRLEGEESGGTVTIHEFDVAAGAGIPLAHSHDSYEETIYGLAGTITFTVDGTPFAIGPGDMVCIRRGAVHSFVNSGDVTSTSLAIITPGILGPEYFRAVAAIVDAAAGGPPDLAALGATMKRHGLTPAP